MHLIRPSFGDQDISGSPRRRSLPVDRFQDFRVVRQAIDQTLAPGAGEPGDLELQARIQVVDHPIEASADKPANARDQHAVENRPEREHCAGNHEPKRKGDDIGCSHVYQLRSILTFRR